MNKFREKVLTEDPIFLNKKKKSKEKFNSLLSELIYYHERVYGKMANGNRECNYYNKFYLVFEYLKCLGYRNKKLNEILNQSIDAKYMCTFNKHDAHLMASTLNLKCSHSICARCILIMKCDNTNTVCINDNCYKEEKVELKNLITANPTSSLTKWNDDDLHSIVKGGSIALNKSLNYIQDIKGISLWLCLIVE